MRFINTMVNNSKTLKRHNLKRFFLDQCELMNSARKLAYINKLLCYCTSVVIDEYQNQL